MLVPRLKLLEVPQRIEYRGKLTDPMVGVTGSRSSRDLAMLASHSLGQWEIIYRVNKGFRRLALCRLDPAETGNGVDAITKVLDSLDDGSLIVGVVEIGEVETMVFSWLLMVNRPREDGTRAKILGKGHGSWDAIVSNTPNCWKIPATYCCEIPQRGPANASGG